MSYNNLKAKANIASMANYETESSVCLD